MWSLIRNNKNKTTTTITTTATTTTTTATTTATTTTTTTTTATRATTTKGSQWLIVDPKYGTTNLDDGIYLYYLCMNRYFPLRVKGYLTSNTH